MKKQYLPLRIILSILIISVALIAASIRNRNTAVLASPVPAAQACCRAGIAQNACVPGTGGEYQYFSTQAECDSYAGQLQSAGYLCNSGEGIDGSTGQPYSGCRFESGSAGPVRCFGGISQSIVNQAYCGMTPTPLPPTPTPTPTSSPTQPTPTPPPAGGPTPTATPTPVSSRLSCNLSAVVSGMNVTLAVDVNNPSGSRIIQYFYNFGSGTGGEKQSALNSMSYYYFTSAYYTASAYVLDDRGVRSDPCYSQQYFVAPPTYTGYPYPTPAPACPYNIQAVFRSAIYGGGWSSNLTTVPYQQIQVGAFRNFDQSYFATDMTLRLLGPGLDTYPTNGSSFTPGSSGDYTLQVGYSGCSTQGFLHIRGTNYYQPVPITTPVPGCGSYNFQYKRCLSCNSSQSVFQDSCGNISNQTNQNDQDCVSLCGITPTPGFTPTPTPAAGAVIYTQPSLPMTGGVRTYQVRELPRTGLPLGTWILAGLLPIGVGLRRFGTLQKAKGNLAKYLWQKRQFNKN